MSSGPWEDFQTSAAPTGGGPWEDYADAAPSDERPWYKKAGEAADDIVRLGADALTFGTADRLAGYMGGEGHEAEKAKTEEARKRAGWAGTAAEVGGSVAGPLGAARAGITALRAVPKALTGAKGVAARSAAMGAEGAAYGTASAAGHGEDLGTGAAIGAAGGAIGSVAGDAISKGVSKAAGVFNKKPVVPTREDLRATSKQAYKESEDAGVIVPQSGVQGLKKDIVDDLTEFGYDTDLHKRTAVVVRDLDRISEGNVTLKGLDILRRKANNARMSDDDQERKLGGMIIGRLDDFVDNLDPREMITGDVTKGAAALKSARRNWSQQAKAGQIDVAVDDARLNAATSGTGGNIDNATRQQLKTILKRKSRSFTKDEKEALHKAVTSGWLLRQLGRLSPSTGGLSQYINIGAGIGTGGATIPITVGGWAAKRMADRATMKNVDQLVRVILAGGDASKTRAAPNAVQRLSQSKRDAIARILMSIGTREAGRSREPVEQ